jgi:hypothetical protein
VVWCEINDFDISHASGVTLTVTDAHETATCPDGFFCVSFFQERILPEVQVIFDGRNIYDLNQVMLIDLEILAIGSR